jgi:hypothetical protein
MMKEGGSGKIRNKERERRGKRKIMTSAFKARLEKKSSLF